MMDFVITWSTFSAVCEECRLETAVEENVACRVTYY